LNLGQKAAARQTLQLKKELLTLSRGDVCRKEVVDVGDDDDK
jgi:hypothetical protein